MIIPSSWAYLRLNTYKITKYYLAIIKLSKFILRQRQYNLFEKKKLVFFSFHLQIEIL